MGAGREHPAPTARSVDVTRTLGGRFDEVPLRRILVKLERPVRPDDGVVTAFRDGQVTLRSARREDGFTLSSQEVGYQGVEPGDLVIHGLDAFAGAVGVADSRGKCSPVYHVVRGVHDTDLRFVAYALRAEARAGFLELQAGNVRQRAVDFRNWDALARIVIPLPDARVQRKVADHLDAARRRLDPIVDSRLKVRHLAVEREEAALRALVMGADGPSRPVSALAQYINGFPFKPTDFTSAGLPVIRIAQLTDADAETDLFDGWVPDHVQLRNGDLVFSWSASLEVRVWDRGQAILNQHLFRVIPSAGVDRDWLRWVLHVGRSDFRELMHGSTMTHITRSMMREVRVPVPHLGSQTDLAGRANDLHRTTMSLVADLDRQLGLLGERTQAMIAGAVTGELEVSEIAA